MEAAEVQSCEEVSIVEMLDEIAGLSESEVAEYISGSGEEEGQDLKSEWLTVSPFENYLHVLGVVYS